jgi:hypothetical protein
MQTVCELDSFRKAALASGMSDNDVADLVNYLSQNPDAGEEMQGTGGCRKLRFAIRANNKGKSGGVRVITFLSGVDLPVFLLTVFGKSHKVNLDKAERNGLKMIAEQIVQTYSRRVERLKPGAKT